MQYKGERNKKPVITNTNVMKSICLYHDTNETGCIDLKLALPNLPLSHLFSYSDQTRKHTFFAFSTTQSNSLPSIHLEELEIKYPISNIW